MKYRQQSKLISFLFLARQKWKLWNKTIVSTERNKSNVVRNLLNVCRQICHVSTQTWHICRRSRITLHEKNCISAEKKWSCCEKKEYPRDFFWYPCFRKWISFCEFLGSLFAKMVYFLVQNANIVRKNGNFACWKNYHFAIQKYVIF